MSILSSKAVKRKKGPRKSIKYLLNYWSNNFWIIKLSKNIIYNFNVHEKTNWISIERSIQHLNDYLKIILISAYHFIENNNIVLIFLRTFF